MAVKSVSTPIKEGLEAMLTVKCECYKLQGRIAQSNIQTSSSTTRSYPGEVEKICHQRLLGLRLVARLAHVGIASSTWSQGGYKV